MSTLARDFGGEFPGGREEWIRRHLEHWLANYVERDDQVQAEADIRRAIEDWPAMLDWASWPQIRIRGEFLRSQEACKAQG